MRRSPVELRPRPVLAVALTGCLATLLVSVTGCGVSSPKGAPVETPSKLKSLAQDAPECCTMEGATDVLPRAGSEGSKVEGIAAQSGSSAAEEVPVREVPDVLLLDQDGKPVRFYTDLVRGRAVAVNFIFTSCKGVCPPLGANFAAISRQLTPRMGKDLTLISVSVDPTTDTPERLKNWSRAFEPGPGWTLVTGEKREVDRLLKALGVFTADKGNHSPFLLMNDGAGGPWTRLHGLTSPVVVAAQLERRSTARMSRPSEEILSRGEERSENPQAREYFTNVRLVDQRGKELRLYDDLLRGKAVVIQTFFCSCRGACPPLVGNMAKIQERFGDRLGKDFRLLSITVDPSNDTPARMKEYAGQLKARPGWYFLTGKEADVDFALRKLGQNVEAKEQHTNLFLVGNDRTGLWKKAMGLAKLDDLFGIVESVLDDRPVDPPSELPPSSLGQE